MTLSAEPASVFDRDVRGQVWLFGRGLDWLVFGGSAAASACLLGVGLTTGALRGDAPEWTFLLCVLGVDVAHVWSTLFRTYLDRDELQRRPLLYSLVPLACYAACVAAHAISAGTFWRALAYVAVFHFVRQQVGWMGLYAHRAGKLSTLDRALDRATIYAVTLHPIVVWHTRLPQPFAWFVPGDFVPGLPAAAAQLTEAFMWTSLAAFFMRQAFAPSRASLGKSLIVVTTFGCWYGGIVVLASDFAFTVTNVLIHGIPYLVLTYRYARHGGSSESSVARRLAALGPSTCMTMLLALAFVEEAGWDRWVWHERAYLFGTAPSLSDAALAFVVPLLALPQVTHYVLDGLIWRARDFSPMLRANLEAHEARDHR
jgi:hypothetical protein